MQLFFPRDSCNQICSSVVSSLLAGKECKHRSENQSVCSILSVGSSKPHLQKEAVAIYNLCHEAGIRFSA